MKHSSASISDVYCFVGSTASPVPCGAARSCPGSGVSAGGWDTVSATTSAPPDIPASVSAFAHTPTDSRRGHRKRPASGECHAYDGMLLSAVLDGGCDSSLGHAAGVSLKARTRRRLLSDRSSPDCGHTCGSVFFRLEGRVVAFLPGLCTPELDLLSIDNGPDGLDGDRTDDAFLDDIVTELGQRPSRKGLPQKYGRTQGCLDDEADIIIGELPGPARPWRRLDCLEAPLVEVLDDGSDMLFGEVESPGDVRYLEALIRGQDDMRTPHPDAALAGAQDMLKDSPLSHADISDIQTHITPPCAIKGSSATCVCSYNTIFWKAQVPNKNVIKIFLKRH